MLILYRILLGIDLAETLVAWIFFSIGLGDGTVSSFNILIWLALLGGLFAILGGGILLKSKGHIRLANGLLLIPALPGFGYGLFILAIIIFQPHWH